MPEKGWSGMGLIIKPNLKVTLPLHSPELLVLNLKYKITSMSMLKEEWQAAINHIRYPYEPSLQEIEKSNIVQKTKRLFQVLLLDLLCMLPLVGVMGLFEQMEIVNLNDHALKEMMEHYPVWAIALFVIVVGPLLEELIFRLHLNRRWNLIAGLAEWFTIASKRVLREEAAALVKEKWDRYYSMFFYLNAAAFALIHMTNFQAIDVPLWVIPFIVLPQFIAGLYFGYIRVKNGGLFWSIALHALHNGVLLVPVLLFEMPVS